MQKDTLLQGVLFLSSNPCRDRRPRRSTIPHHQISTSLRTSPQTGVAIRPLKSFLCLVTWWCRSLREGDFLVPPKKVTKEAGRGNSRSRTRGVPPAPPKPFCRFCGMHFCPQDVRNTTRMFLNQTTRKRQVVVCAIVPHRRGRCPHRPVM